MTYFHWLGERAEPFHQVEREEREQLERELPCVDEGEEE